MSCPPGTFFIIANTAGFTGFDEQAPPAAVDDLVRAAKLEIDPATRGLRDYNFCRHLSVVNKVTAIPPSAFYSPEHRHLAANLARFAFCKPDADIRKAIERLKPA